MRWPAIIFSRICALSRTYDVFAVSRLPREMSAFADLRDESISSVFLLPSICADARVASDGESDMPSLALAAATFLTSVRGLPLDETEIETDGGIFKVERDVSSGKYGILLPKCKVIFTNKEMIVDKMPIKTSVVRALGNRICVSECADYEHFDHSSLARIALECDAVGAVAYSRVSEGIVARHRLFDPTVGAVGCAMAAARALGLGISISDVYLTLNGATFTLRDRRDGIFISCNDPRPMTFVAPDIF